jgi:hypothetical protein
VLSKKRSVTTPANTNVRQDSDVDVCVRLNSTLFYQLPAAGSQNPADYGLGPATISFADFRNLVGQALVDQFGAAGVTRGNKAFDVHENTYRIDADVVATFEHRRYTGFDVAGHLMYISGVEFRPDAGPRVINWPDHTAANGVAKNNRTGRVYKRTIRILKRLRNKMQDDNIAAAKDIASFLIESLAWNTPDEHFALPDYSAIVRELLIHIYNKTKTQTDCGEWGEVNELKYLFRDAHQPWTRQQANDFIRAAWNYLGFK